MKSKKKYIISFIVILIAIFGFALIKVQYKNTKNDIIINDSNINTINKQDIGTKLYINGETTFDICSLNEKGQVKNSKISFKKEGEEAYKELINYLLVKKLNNDNTIRIPKDLKILDMKIWNETLLVNLNTKANKIKISNPISESKVLTTLVNTLLINKDGYTDIQFLINSKRIDKLFHYTNTRNPFMKFS